MNLAIVGSRTFNDWILFELEVSKLIKQYPEINTIISGGAKGADKLAEKYAKNYKLKKIIHYPEWDVWGNSAGMIRNKKIIKDADILIAFWDGKSSGTENVIRLASIKGIPFIKILYDEFDEKQKNNLNEWL